MRNIIIAISIFISFVLAANVAHAYLLDIKLVSQDPFPAERGEAVDLLFNADIKDTSNPPQDLQVQIFPEYPFSLVGDSVKDFGNVANISTDEHFTFKFRVYVDSNASEGGNEIKAGYSLDGGNSITKKFNVTVAETKTDFDVVVQDISGSSVSLGIVNAGRNDASSLVVRIPTQDNFNIGDISSTVIGDLHKGDFTLVTFTISPKTGEVKPLLVDISYTDLTGNRLTLEKQVPLKISSLGLQGTRTTSANILRNGQLYEIIAGIALVVAVVLVYKKMKRKRK